MGSLLKSKSTRVQRGRSVRTSPKPHRTPPDPKPSEFRTTADVPADALKEIHRKLEIAGAVAYMCSATLRAEAVNEQDIALCLRRLVGDEIDRQMEEIDRLLGRDKTYESVEDRGAV